MSDNTVEEKMPTYTCLKCARTFSQKSHFTAHQKKKNDCSNQTDTTVIKNIIEKKEMLSINDIYFDINNYKFLEIPPCIPSNVMTTDTLYKMMAYNEKYMSEYHGILFYVNGSIKHPFCLPITGPYDILILENDVTISLSRDGNMYQFTEKDIKYFPMHMFNIDYRIEVFSKNPIKIISLQNKIHRSSKLMKYHTNNKDIYFEYNNQFGWGVIKKSYFDPICFNLIEMDMLSNDEICAMLSDDNKDNKDGFIYPIKTNVINSFHDVIILNENVTAIIYNRNGSVIELNLNDLKYLPVHLLTNAVVEIIYKKETEFMAITFFHNKIQNVSYNQGSILFEEGMIKVDKEKKTEH